MLGMKKTVYGSQFACFEKNSNWYDCVFERTPPVSPKKMFKKRTYERFENEYSECDEISIIQIQQDGKDFLIEYVIL